MQSDFSDYNFIPAAFWIGHLVVALIGFLLLRRHADKVPSVRRSAYFVIGALLILAGLVPAAFASMVTVALVLGAFALGNVPIGIVFATALASPVGLISAFLVVYLIVRVTAFVFAKLTLPNRVASS